MKRNKLNILFAMMLSLVVFIWGTNNVNAATFKAGSFFSIKSWTGSPYNTNLKSVDGKVAYCPEFNAAAPPNGATVKKYTPKCWSQHDNYVSGQIIKIVRNKYSDTRKKYAMASAALNYYNAKHGCTQSNSTTTVNSTVKDIVTKAKKYVDKYKTSKKLPTISIKPGSKILTYNGTNYVSKQIEIKGMVSNKYGSDGTKYTTSTVPEYKVTLTTSVGTAQLCTNAAGTEGCISNGATINNGNYYLIIKRSGRQGGNASIKIEGTNKSTYPSANRWVEKTWHQKVITLSSKKINRKRSSKVSFSYTAPAKYSVSIEKVNESGEPLNGAGLELYTSHSEDGSDTIKVLCKVGDNEEDTSCQNSNVESNDTTGFKTGNYICYRETKTPSGYMKVTPLCEQINISSNKDYYYKTKVSSDQSNTEEMTEEITETEFINANKYNTLKSYFEGADDTNKYQDSNIETLYKYEITKDGTTTTIYSTDPEYSDETATEVRKIEPSLQGNKVCAEVNGNQVIGQYVSNEETSTDFCNGEYTYNSVSFTNGSVAITVGNALNSVNISKKSITGDEEVPGATLEIYEASNGKCSNTLAKAKDFVYSEITSTDSSTDTDDDETESEEESSTENTEESREFADDEPTEEEAEEDDNSEIASTGLKWVSSYTPATVYGLAEGDYCLKETLPPSGYKNAQTVVNFTIDEYGNITTTSKDNYDEETKTLVIRDEVTKISISKTDAATTKELPGAKIKICKAEKNDQGNYQEVVDDMGICRPVTLLDGSSAEWTSTNEPHKVEGLADGAYYLIETTAPTGYSTAESILFILKEDGTLTDANGKSLASNKLVMKDAPIKDVKTGVFKMVVTVVISIAAVGIGFYVYLKKLNPAK